MKISKLIAAAIGKVKKITPLRTGGLRIECLTADQANKALTIEKVGEKPVKFSPPRAKSNLVQGILGPIELDVTEEEINEELEGTPNFAYAKRKTKYIDGQKSPIKTMILYYEETLPAKCFLGAFAFRVTKVKETPNRCFKCHRYGHLATNCRSKVRCARCAGNHEYKDCQADIQVCKTCNKAHSLAYKGCEAYKTAQRVVEYKATNQLTYAQAAKVLRKQPRTESQASTSADVAAPKLTKLVPAAPIKKAGVKPAPTKTQIKRPDMRSFGTQTDPVLPTPQAVINNTGSATQATKHCQCSATTGALQETLKQLIAVVAEVILLNKSALVNPSNNPYYKAANVCLFACLFAYSSQESAPIYPKLHYNLHNIHGI